MFLRSLVLGGLFTGALLAAQSKPQPTLQRPTTGDMGQLVTDTKHLTISASTSAKSAAPGAKVSLFVDVAPKPKMHVYAPEQKDDYIAGLADGSAAEGVRAEPIVSAPGRPTSSRRSRKRSCVYSKTVPHRRCRSPRARPKRRTR